MCIFLRAAVRADWHCRVGQWRTRVSVRIVTFIHIDQTVGICMIFDSNEKSDVILHPSRQSPVNRMNVTWTYC